VIAGLKSDTIDRPFVDVRIKMKLLK
jgi:hypothetical protein